MMILASILQLLLAATFVIMPIVAYRYGTAAQRAADADAMGQGLPSGTLAQHGIRMQESKAEMMFPLAIAVVLAALAVLNLAGSGAGRTLTWILQPIMLLAGGFVTAGQVFVVRYIQAAIRKSDDQSLRNVNVESFIRAAQAEFPAWVRPLIIARFLLATAGSILILGLLALA